MDESRNSVQKEQNLIVDKYDESKRCKQKKSI